MSMLGASVALAVLLAGGALCWALAVWWPRRDAPPAGAQDGPFALLRPAAALRAEDVGLRAADAGPPDPQLRPLHPPYVPRRAIAPGRLATAAPAAGLREDALLRHLRAGTGLLLVGRPLEGKTRTLFELARRLEGWLVLTPRRGAPVPPEPAFAPLRGRHVLLLLDDLDEYRGVEPHLGHFCARLTASGVAWVVAASCRPGAPLAALRAWLAAPDGPGPLADAISLTLGLVPLAPEEKQALAARLGLEWKPTDALRFATPGSICLADLLAGMRQRVLTLAPDARALLAAARLLDEAGLGVTRPRLRGVAARLFQRNPPDLGPALAELAEKGLIRPPEADTPIHLHHAYLQRPGGAWGDADRRRPSAAALGAALLAEQDRAGLAMLGTTMLRVAADPAGALACFDSCLRLDENQPEVWLARGLALRALGRPADALRSFEAARLRRPGYAAAWREAGLTLTGLERHAEAQAAFEEALTLAPDDAECQVCLGGALERLGRADRALAAFERATELQPELAAAWFGAGRALAALARREEALEAFDRGLALAPDDATAWHLRGEALAETGQYESALVAFQRSLDQDGLQPAVWYHLGSAYLKVDEPGPALEALARALDLRPDLPEAWRRKGQALAALRRWEEAIEAQDAALARRPDFALAHFDRALALRALGRHPDALVAWGRVLALRPDLAAAACNRGVTLAELGRQEQAAEAFRRATTLDPDLAEAWANASIALGKLARFEQAMEARDRAQALRPAHPDEPGVWGYQVVGPGRGRDGLDMCGQAGGTASDFPRDWFRRGGAAWRAGLSRTALLAFDHALGLRADFPEAWNSLGVTLAQLRRADEALHAYDQALRLRDDFAEAWANKGTLLAHLDRPAEALEALRRAWGLRQRLAPEVAASISILLRNLGVAPEALATPPAPAPPRRPLLGAGPAAAAPRG